MVGSDDIWTAEDRRRLLDDVRHWLWLYLGSGVLAPQGTYAAAAQLLDLPEADVRRLCAVHFVLSPVVAEVVDQAAPAALHDGARGSAVMEHGRGIVKGRPDWPGTLRRRHATGGDPTHYVYHVPRRGLWYDKELAVLLEQVRVAAEDALGGPVEHGDIGMAPQHADAAPWKTACASLGQRAARLLMHPRLGGLATRRSGAPHPESADRLPAPRWWPAVDAARALARRLVVNGDRAALLDMLAARVLEPASADTLFELWATLATLVTLEQRGWHRQAVRLVGTGTGRPLARYALGNAPRRRIAVYAQHTPPVWRRASRYSAVFTHYGLAGGVRRPDMILELTQEGRKRWLLIEVKRTADPGYIAESIYKVFGYLADFGALVTDAPEPHAILLVWQLGEMPHRAPLGPGPLVVASPATFSSVLGAAIERA